MNLAQKSFNITGTVPKLILNLISDLSNDVEKLGGRGGLKIEII